MPTKKRRPKVRKTTLRRPRRLDEARLKKSPRFRILIQRYNRETRCFDWIGKAGTFAADNIAMVDRIWDQVTMLIAEGDFRVVDSGSVAPALEPGEDR